MIYDWNHDGLQQLTGASRTGALESTVHLWSPPLQFPRHCVKCGINRLVRKPALSSNMGFQLILLHHIGSSYCVAPTCGKGFLVAAQESQHRNCGGRSGTHRSTRSTPINSVMSAYNSVRLTRLSGRRHDLDRNVLTWTHQFHIFV